MKLARVSLSEAVSPWDGKSYMQMQVLYAPDHAIETGDCHIAVKVKHIQASYLSILPGDPLPKFIQGLRNLADLLEDKERFE